MRRGDGWTLDQGTLVVTGYVSHRVFRGVRHVAVIPPGMLIECVVLMESRRDLDRLARRRPIGVQMCNFQVEAARG